MNEKLKSAFERIKENCRNYEILGTNKTKDNDFKILFEALTAQQQPVNGELLGRMLLSLEKMTGYVSRTCDYLVVRNELNKAKEIIREAEAIARAEQKGEGE